MPQRDNIVIRTQLLAADIPAVFELEQACFSDPWPSKAFENELQNPYSVCALAFEGERLIGYIFGMSLYEVCDINNVAVLPEKRGQGVATLMLNVFLEMVKKGGAERALLEVRAGNTPAIELYKKFGFSVYGERKGYYVNPAEDAVLMVVSL